MEITIPGKTFFILRRGPACLSSVDSVWRIVLCFPIFHQPLCESEIEHQWLLLLTWFNFNPSMDK